jgi:Ras family protein T1
LISTYISSYFSEVVPGLMPRVRRPPDATGCVTTVIDSQGGDAALLAAVAAKQQSSSSDTLTALLETEPSIVPDTTGGGGGGSGMESVDSIVLVYDLDRPETFFRLENHWLPLLERCYNGKVRGDEVNIVFMLSFYVSML